MIVLILFGLFSAGIIKSLAWKYKNPQRFCICFCKILGDTTNSEFILSLFLAYFSLHHENSMNWGSTSTSASSHDHEFSKEGFVPSSSSRRRRCPFFSVASASVFVFNLLFIIAICAFKITPPENRFLTLQGSKPFHTHAKDHQKKISKSVIIWL